MSENAIIYCRVSSVAQVEEGHGLESQETRCREYAARKHYNVIESFYERAVSGGVADRPSFNAMLTEETLDLLDAVTPSVLSRPPYELPKMLDLVVETAPELRADHRYLRLIDQVERM